MAKTHKAEKYGRWLVELFADGVDINAKMVEKGHAVAYMVGPSKIKPTPN